MTPFAIILCAYLLGSIPFGLIITKLAGLGDIRRIGSGNIGATNVLRTGKKSLALLTVLLDGGKGTVAVLLTLYLGLTLCSPHCTEDSFSTTMDLQLVAGFAVFIGHLYPVWLKFKGGKGVATAMGVIVALAWPIGLITMLLWLIVAIVSRFSSLAALIALCSTPVTFFLIGDTGYRAGYTENALWLYIAIACFIVFKHKDNIQRLLNHTESKIGKLS